MLENDIKFNGSHIFPLSKFVIYFKRFGMIIELPLRISINKHTYTHTHSICDIKLSI